MLSFFISSRELALRATKQPAIINTAARATITVILFVFILYFFKCIKSTYKRSELSIGITTGTNPDPDITARNCEIMSLVQ
jgi:hypothetical protein